MDMIDSTDKDDVSMTNDLNSEGTGITPQTSVMMMASFRIDREVWAKFGAIAKRERLTATDVLTEYIQRCTDNDKTEYAVRIDTDTSASTDTYDTDKFNEAVRMAVSTLSLLSKDDVSKRIDDAIDNRVLPLINSAEGVISIDEVKRLIATSSNELIELIPSDIPTLETIKAEIETSIEPIKVSIGELETYTQSQFKTVRDELKKPLDRTVTTEPIAIDTTATIEDLPTTETSPDAPTIKEPTVDVKRAIDKLTNDPKLKARIDTGLAQGLKGAALGQWLADDGFLNNRRKNYDNSTLSRFKQAIEHLTKSQA